MLDKRGKIVMYDYGMACYNTEAFIKQPKSFVATSIHNN